MRNKINNFRVNEIRYQQAIHTAKERSKSTDFQEILDSKLKGKNGKVKFSKHAQTRLEERNIKLLEQDIGKISEAIDIAKQKGIKNSLIVTEQVVYIANVDSRTVITAMESMKGKVFTNVDGVVNI